MINKRKGSGEPIIVLIDGQCNLCHAITRFVIKRDPFAKFRFASIQSEQGQLLLREGNLSGNDLDTFVLIESGRYYTKSTAALQLCRKLRGLWPLLYSLRIVPIFVRDRVYDWVAGSRYRWFGHNDRCLVPTEEIRKRFLAESWQGRQDEKIGQ
jgi:predicted DCC family thiol-disulfide oxidoreductase YuxK